MKLEVGMYVKTKKGIAKIKTLDSLDMIALTDKKDIYFGITSKDMLNFEIYDDGTVLREPSYDIIDLIEVGDYVNGYLVLEKDIRNRFRYIDLEDRVMKYLDNLDIKSIITKEQIESISYKLGDE